MDINDGAGLPSCMDLSCSVYYVIVFCYEYYASTQPYDKHIFTIT